MLRRLDENEPVISLSNSIKNLKSHIVTNYLFSKFFSKIEDLPSDSQKIAQQILIVCIAIGPGDGEVVEIPGVQNGILIYKSHYYAALTVILSHVIDDIVDKIFEVGSALFRQDLLDVSELAVLVPEENDFYIEDYLDLLYADFKHRILDELSEPEELTNMWDNLEETLDIFTTQYHAFQVSLIKMVLAGLILTENITNSKIQDFIQDTSLKPSTPEHDNLRRRFLYTFKSFEYLVDTGFISPDQLKEYSTEVMVSIASSLLGWFNAMENSIDFDPLFYELFDPIFAPWVFLDNFGHEKESGNIEFIEKEASGYRKYQRPATTDEYSYSINIHWAALKDYILHRMGSNGPKPYIKRKLIQFCVTHLIMSSERSQHNYWNLKYSILDENNESREIDHSSLINTYAAIFREIVALGWVRISEIQEYIEAIL